MIVTDGQGSPRRPRPTAPRFGARVPPALQAAALAALLQALPMRRAEAQSHADLKYSHYAESDDRIAVDSGAVLYLMEVTPVLTIRIDGIYDSISGATPTGAPSDTTASEAFDDALLRQAVANRGVFALAGATPTPPSSDSSSSSSASSSSSGATSNTAAATDTSSASGVPMAELQDTRYAASVQLSRKVASHLLSPQLSISSEDDYLSLGVALKDGIELNRRNTTLTVGAAYTHDKADVFWTGGTDTKDTLDLMVGVSQVLGPRTQATLNGVLQQQDGYLNDQYKVVELNGDEVPESRPDSRSKQIVLAGLTHAFKRPDASVEAAYRFSTDDFGIDAHTMSLAWHQRVLPAVRVSPVARYHTQSAADFYAVRFTGEPEHYSSDYRISEMDTVSAGLQVAWQCTKQLAVDAAFDRYEQDGQDGVTDDDMYAKANVMTVGARWTF